jgi:hypothetical protein
MRILYILLLSIPLFKCLSEETEEKEEIEETVETEESEVI